MRYFIDVNVARRGAPSVWKRLVDENDDVCAWDNEADAWNALREERRAQGDLRIMRFVNGIGHPFVPVA